MMKALIFMTAALVLTVNPTERAAAQSVEDVVRLPGGAVWIALPGAPERADISAAGDDIEIRLPGYMLDPVRIEPAGPAGFSALEVASGLEGSRLIFRNASGIAQAELRAGGVLLSPGGIYRIGAPASDLQGASPTQAPETTSVSGASASAPRPGAEPETATADPPERMTETGPDTRADAPPAALQPADRTPSNAATPAPAEAAVPAAPEPVAAGPCPDSAQALDDAPWDLELLTNHGECLAAAGGNRDAAAIFERVLAFEPEHFRAALALARLKQAQGSYAEAAALFETAAGSAMTDGEALAARAAARRARENEN
ncbi:MAG: tetratricopeptide repeat protein [Oceanicaulis sp.]